MTPPKPLYGSTIVSISMLLVACGDVPTGPPEAVPPAVQLEAETAANLTFAVDDALDRLLPELPASERLPGLQVALTGVNVALTSRQPLRLAASSISLRQALDAYAATQEDSELNPDLAAVRLLLDEVQLTAVTPPVQSSQSR